MKHIAKIVKEYRLDLSTQRIYNDSTQNYGAPKITEELRKADERIAERTVCKYMRQMGIRAQWIKPWIATTIDSDFSKELNNALDEQFNPERPNKENYFI